VKEIGNVWKTGLGLMSERTFQTAFAQACIIKKIVYMEIPDAVKTAEMMSTASYRGRIAALKRPADCVIVTSEGAVVCELKHEYGQSKSHQVNNCVASNHVCACTYLFLRQKKGKYYVEYHDLTSKTVLAETDNILKLIDLIVELQRKSRNMEKSLDRKTGNNNLESLNPKEGVQND